jgi:deoxyribonuclease-4
MSIAGGLSRAFERGAKVGCETIQIFLKSPGNWALSPLDTGELECWNEAKSRAHIDPVIAHDCYLVNLASPDENLRQRSRATLLSEMRLAGTLGITLFVIHPGSHMGAGEEEGMHRVADSLESIFTELGRTDITVLLETTAGQGTSLGYRFEHQAGIMGRCSSRVRLGICLDTCHLFASGYDVRSAKGYAAVMEELDSTIGLDKVRAVHMNDSEKDFGSRVDRHAHIGKGKIGLVGMSCFLTDERLETLPMILETPKGIGIRHDRRNLGVLRKLRTRQAVD